MKKLFIVLLIYFVICCNIFGQDLTPPFSVVTSDFGPRDLQGQVGSWFHPGIDYSAVEGSIINAVEGGTIQDLDYSTAGGWTITVNGANGIWGYCHMFKYNTLPQIYGNIELRNATLVNPDDLNITRKANVIIFWTGTANCASKIITPEDVNWFIRNSDGSYIKNYNGLVNIRTWNTVNTSTGLNIGSVGNSGGNGTYPFHLHLGLRDNNPLLYVARPGATNYSCEIKRPNDYEDGIQDDKITLNKSNNKLAVQLNTISRPSLDLNEVELYKDEVKENNLINRFCYGGRDDDGGRKNIQESTSLTTGVFPFPGAGEDLFFHIPLDVSKWSLGKHDIISVVYDVRNNIAWQDKIEVEVVSTPTVKIEPPIQEVPDGGSATHTVKVIIEEENTPNKAPITPTYPDQVILSSAVLPPNTTAEANCKVTVSGYGPEGWSPQENPIVEKEFELPTDATEYTVGSYTVSNEKATDEYVATAILKYNDESDETDAYDKPEAEEHPEDHPDEAVVISPKKYPDPYYYDPTAKIGVLLNGWSISVACMLGKWRIPICGVRKDFHIVAGGGRDFNDLDVIIIPSAGLKGLENSSFFKQKLEYFVNNGGTVICLTQPKGEEWNALPLPENEKLLGYGWEQDQSCYTNACFISNSDVICAGQTSVNFSGNVDGYFENWPASAKAVFSRSKNYMPSLIKYPLGSGQVVISALYSDWGYAHGCVTNSESRLLWDMVMWGREADKGIPEYKPGVAFSLPVKVVNNEPAEASFVRLYINQPRNEGLDSIDVLKSVTAGDSATVNWNTTGKTNLGIWLVDYSLIGLDSLGNKFVVQEKSAGQRVAISAQYQKTTPSPDLIFSVIKDKEDYIKGEDAYFTIKIFNNGNSPRKIFIKENWCHEGYKTVGTVTVPAESSITTRYCYKYAWGSWYGYTGPWELWGCWFYFIDEITRNELNCTKVGGRIFELTQSAEIVTDKSSYYCGENVQLDLVVNNPRSVEYTCEAYLYIKDNAGNIIFNNTTQITLLPEQNYLKQYNFMIPYDAAVGKCNVNVDFSISGKKVGYAQETIEIKNKAFNVSENLPETWKKNNNNVSFCVKNLCPDTIQNVEFNLSLLAPDGQVQFYEQRIFNLSAREEKEVSFDVVLSKLKKGDYVLNYQAKTTVYDMHASKLLPCKISQQYLPEKNYYTVRETYNSTIRVINEGVFELAPLSYEINFEDGQCIVSDNYDLYPGQNIEIPLVYNIPSVLAPGLHYFTSNINVITEPFLTEKFSFSIRQPNLCLIQMDTLFNAGNTMRCYIKNTGGVDAQCTGGYEVYDELWNTIATTAFTDIYIQPGDSAEISLPLPDQITTGKYFRYLYTTDVLNWKYYTLCYDMVNIKGLEATLAVKTDQDMYLSIDDIFTETITANQGPDIIDANLHLAIFAGYGLSQATWQYPNWNTQSYNNLDITATGMNLKRSYKFNKVLDAGIIGAPLGTFSAAYGIAADGKGHIYVSDQHNDRIQRLDTEGNFEFKWGTYGSQGGMFYWPGGVDVDKNGNVFVADSWNSRIQKFDSLGNFLFKWGSDGSNPGQFYEPMDITTDASGNIYVADYYYSGGYVNKFDSLGNFITRWRGLINTETPYYQPVCIDYDGKGFIYTGDYKGYIQKFDTLGNYITRWRSSDRVGNSPIGLEVGNDGYIYVREKYWEITTNSYRGRILKLDQNGTLIAKWAEKGSGDGELPSSKGHISVDGNFVYVTDYETVNKYDCFGNFYGKYGNWGTIWYGQPKSIAVDTDDNVYISHYQDSYGQVTTCMAIFDSSGGLIKKWGALGTGNGQFKDPRCSRISNDGKLYILDYYNCNIQVFDDQQNYLYKWGSKGSGDGQFTGPVSLTIDKDGYVYVTDENLNRVQKFDNNGNFILKWGTTGSGNGQFSSPSGITVDQEGCIYVVDSGNNRIQKFNSYGNYILKWGAYGSANGYFYRPKGISVDKQNMIYVADCYNYRIQVFDINGVFKFKFGGSWEDLDCPFEIAFNSKNESVILDFWPRIQFWGNSYAQSGYWCNRSFDAGKAAPFGTINWMGKQPEGTRIKIRTATAAPYEWNYGPWSEYYTQSGSQISSPAGRYIKLEMILETDDPDSTPEVSKIWINYGEQGEIVWELDSLINSSQSLTSTDTNMVGNLGRTGKFFLTGQLTSQNGQIVANSNAYPFYISQSDIGLALKSDKPYYRANDSLKITALIKNLSDQDAENLVLSIKSDSTELCTESFNLAKGETRPIYINDVITKSFLLNAQLTANNAVVSQAEEYIQIVKPFISAAWFEPDQYTVGVDSFPVYMEVYNEGPVEAYLTTNFGNKLSTDTIDVSEGLLITRYFSIGRDTTITASLRGDSYQDLSCRLHFGINGWVSMAANSLYPEGSLEIPYTVYSTGELPVNMDVRFVLYDHDRKVIDNFTRQFYLQANDYTVDKLNFSLPEGQYILEYTATCSGKPIELDYGQTAFRVGKYNKAVIDTITVCSDTCATDGALTGSIIVSNTGANSFDGRLKLDLGFWSYDSSLTLEVDKSDTIAFKTYATMPAGNYSAKGQVLYGSWGIDSMEIPFNLKPDIYLVDYPQYISADAGNAGEVHTTTRNRGTAYGQERLKFNCGDIADVGQNLFIVPGQVAYDTLRFYPEEDLEDKDYPAVLALGSVEKDVTLHVNGCNLDVAVAFDQPAYYEGDNARVSVNVVNKARRSDRYNTVLTYNEQQYKLDFATGWLDAVDAINLPGHLSMQWSPDDTTLPMNLWTYSYPDSGTWVSPAYPILAGGSQPVSWISQEPLSTSLSVAARYSSDGVGWYDWTDVSNGGSFDIPDAGYCQLKFVLRSQDKYSTPALSELQFGDKMITTLDDFRADSTKLYFDIPVHHAGQKLWAGVYSIGGRSVYLNSYYIRELKDSFNLYADKDIYDSGSEMLLTAQANQNGILTWNIYRGISPAINGQVDITAPVTCFAVQLPEDAVSGPSALNYVFKPAEDTTREIIGEAAFDINGYIGRIWECTLDKQNYAPGEPMNVRYKLEFNRPGSYTIKGWLKDRERNYVDAFSLTRNFNQGVSTIIIPDTMTLVVSGMAELIYAVYKPLSDDNSLLLASGAESFDVIAPDSIAPQILSLTAIPSIFKPALSEVTNISLTLSEACNWARVDIRNQTGNTLKNFYYYDAGTSAINMIWNGKDQYGNLVPGGQYNVVAYACDYAGNLSSQAQTSVEVILDNIPPVTTLNIGQPNYGTAPVFVNNSTEFILTAEDDISGVSYIQYALDDTPQFTIYDLPFTIPSNGSHIVYYRSIDNAGNIEEIKTLSVNLDNDAPEISLSTDPAAIIKDGQLIVNPQTIMILVVNDGLGSGVKQVKYSLDNGPLVDYDAPISMAALSEGKHGLTILAEDNLDNINQQQKQVYIDATGPAIAVNIGDPKIQKDGSTNITSNTGISASASDSTGGVMSIHYRINGGEWMPCGSQFNISGNDGAYELEFSAVDSLGNISTAAASLMLDNTGPVVSSTLGDPKYLSDGIYVTSNTGISMDAVDATGVDSLFFEIDDGGWQPYAGVFTLSTEGQHQVSWQARDLLGNYGAQGSLALSVDNTGPVNNIGIADPKAVSSGKVYVNSNSAVSINAEDLPEQSASGIGWQKYQIAGQDWQNYIVPLNISGVDGEYKISASSGDNLGNQSIITDTTIHLDNTAPVTAVNVGTPKYQSTDLLYVTSNTGIDIRVMDAGCGVSLSEYGLDGGGWTPYIGSKTFNIATEGIHQIVWHSSDHLGNQENGGSLSLAVDNTSPVSQIEISDPKCEASGQIFVTSVSTIAITGNDPVSGEVASGLKAVEYRINGSPWSVYDSPLTLTGSDGQYVVEYRSRDNVGNAEDTRSVTVYLDNTAPSTTISVGDPQYLANGSTYVTSGTPIYVSASDQGCGVQSSEYRIDGGVWITFNSATPINAGTEGRHTVSWRSIDRLGNVENEASIILNVDNTHTISQFDVGLPQYVYGGSDSTLVTSITNLTLWAYDPISADVASGVGSVEYRINKGPWNTILDSMATFNLTGTDGQDTIDYRSADHLNNLEPARTKLLVLDNTPPSVNIASPAGLIFVNGTIKITGTASDLHFATYWLEYGSGSNPSSWTKIGTEHYSPVVGGILETWDMTSLPQGYYTIKLTSNDLVGNTAEDRVTVFVGQPEFAFEINGFNKCEGVALDRVGNIYVADRNASQQVGHNRIAKFDPFGVLLMNIFDENKSKPDGVDVDFLGNIFVTEWAGREVCKYSPEGQLLMRIGGFGQPNGIVVDKKGYIYVADQTGCSIAKYDSLGAKVMTITDVRHPDGVALDSLGNIYSVEMETAHLVKYDSLGNLLARVGSYGSLPGQFDHPGDVEIDKYQNIWVVDRNNDRVQVFDPEFNLLGILGAMGHDAGQFNKPEGIAVSDMLDIFVADRNNDRVQKFVLPAEDMRLSGRLLFGPSDGADPLKIEQAINWPNPFNSTREATKIRIVVNKNASVSVKIYTLGGRMVSDIKAEIISGINELEWSGRNNLGELVNNGVYNYVVTATAGSEKATAQGKIVVMK